ncbi:hypothetical protein AURANDRAFT_67735 [Aureococcus anophagefferens]|uniref:Uncharacterized protein n=1 Tax=Aureococcus anophagefferens TaxID=44056 RepID=F0YM81_AURAN|nr:hypothetical protein AURANDRAFT_67735 [Aureococcus anophagefferens]EGB03780.1 hypothetical protein AURANDRAFT_67735 [Aureococcus anophagefferens]|eukprot:XP_009041510.1 hypothetical protein AURANDRAFT_67735 [Aureococcus anophagefferens]
MTRFGSLLAGAVRDGFAKDVDDVNSVDYGGCKSEVPEADTTSITAIIDQQREEGDAKAAMTLAREYTMEFVDEEHAAAKREEEDLAYAERLDIELKDELVAERRDRELKDGDCAKAAQLELDGAEAFERGLAEAKGLEEAKRLEARIARSNFAARKRRDALASDEDLNVGQCWRDAMKRVDLEDVGDAVALSVQLPSLADVKVEASGKVVKVVATRASAALRASNWASKDAGPKTITLKFELVCPKSASDVSYDYDCEAGLLHLFLDGIQLASLDEATRAKTLTSLRARLAQSAAAKVASFKKAFAGGPAGDAAPDLSLVGLGITPKAI